jgi:hypothetical protein
MGFLSKLTGAADNKLLTTGQLGRGLILHVEMTGTTISAGGGLAERVCVFTVEVRLDGAAPYAATVRQRFPEIQLAQISPGNTIVAVRVDPANPANVALDWSTPPPSVTMASQPGQPSAADLLATGNPCEVVIVETQPLGMKNSAGLDMHAFLFSVFVPGQVPYQAQVGNPVPVAAVPLLFPGSRLPAKVSPSEPRAIAVDWAAALASFQ